MNKMVALTAASAVAIPAAAAMPASLSLNDRRLIEASAGMIAADRALQVLHETYDDASDRDDYQKVEATRSAHIETLIDLRADSAAGMRAKARALKQRELCETFEEHGDVAISLADDVIGLGSGGQFEDARELAEVTPSELDGLWLERQRLVRQANVLYERLDEAREQLPPWAKSGPEHINAAGERCGRIVGWPEVAQLPAPPTISYAVRCIRVAPGQIKKNFEHYVSLYPGRSKRALRLRAKAREHYRASMRELIARLRDQRAAEQALGIPEMEAVVDTLYDQRWEITEKIEKLPPTLNQAAARALIEVATEAKAGCTANDPDSHLSPVLVMLRGMRAHLTGAVRSTVDRLLDEPDTSLAEMDLTTA